MSDDRDEGGIDPARFWSRYSGSGGAGEPGSGAGGAGDAGSGGAGATGASHGAGAGRTAGGAAGAGAEHRCLEWCPICRGAERLEDSIPPELKEQFRVVQHDALLLARALIEAHLARIEADRARDEARRRDRAAGSEGTGTGPRRPVEDIPID